MVRPNRINRFDYSDELADYHSSSLWTMRNIMAVDRWHYWTIKELHVELHKKGFGITENSVSAHIRTLRKPPPKGGQYPCGRRQRDPDNPLLLEYQLGVWGTGVLDKDVKCANCEALEVEIDALESELASLRDREKRRIARLNEPA